MKALKRIAAGLALVGLTALLWLGAGNAYARYREKRTERAWVQSFGTFQDLLDRYPKTETNETARRLEELVKPLVLDPTAKTQESLAARVGSAAESRQSEAKRGRNAVSRYLTGELEKQEATIARPPPEVRDFLTAHAADLRAVEEELLTSLPPVWGFETASSWERRPTPEIYSLNSLQSILLGSALQESAFQDDAAAHRTLEASWRLNQNLRRIPDLSCQIVALAIARRQVGVLRKIDVDSISWSARLAEHDFKRSLLDMWLLSTWPSANRARELEKLESNSERNVLKRLSSWVLRPLTTLIWSNTAEGMRKDYIEIRESTVVHDLPASRPWWRSTPSQILLSLHLPSVHSSFRRVDEFLLDAELTDKVLQAQELRRQNGRNWPNAIPGIESTRLPEGRWLYSVSPEGTMSLVLSQEPSKDRGVFKLPLCFTSS